MVAAQHEKSSRDRVLAAARDLFNSHGFHQTSMAELASAAQVSVGQIYRLFKGKEDIIEAIVHADADQWAEDVDILRKRLDSGELSIDDTFEQLMLHVIDEKDEALSFDILAESFRNPTVGEMIGTMCGRFREALDGAEEMILACMFGLGHRSLSRPNLSPEASARRAAQMIVAGLKAVR
ncbi:MAG: TetR family transcriptional regulator [Sphingobium sp.]|nr:MAG: TetR family transcriptional regulator [Sphingobium sp.]